MPHSSYWLPPSCPSSSPPSQCHITPCPRPNCHLYIFSLYHPFSISHLPHLSSLRCYGYFMFWIHPISDVSSSASWLNHQLAQSVLSSSRRWTTQPTLFLPTTVPPLHSLTLICSIQVCFVGYWGYTFLLILSYMTSVKFSSQMNEIEKLLFLMCDLWELKLILFHVLVFYSCNMKIQTLITVQMCFWICIKVPWFDRPKTHVHPIGDELSGITATQTFLDTGFSKNSASRKVGVQLFDSHSDIKLINLWLM